MKILIIFCLVSIFIVPAFSIGRPLVTDTIYYMVDTARVPVKDRMMRVGIEGGIKAYNILCQCSRNFLMPTFAYRLNQPELTKELTGDSIKNIDFISLSTLLKLSIEEGSVTFNKNHIVFFIEVDKNRHFRHKVFLLPPISLERAGGDSETIH